MSSTPQHPSPYQGLIPYSEEDAPFFFGREKETRLISANLFASSLTLLYGASGVGKSSVLRAGVAHQLRQRDDLLVVVFNAWQRDPAGDLKAEIAASAARLDEKLTPPSELLPLADYLAAYSKKLDRRVMVILDQFEEYFLYHAQDDAFADEFARALLNADAQSSFLISIREDFYAKLDRFEGRIPALYDNYFRIEHLDRKAARAALEKPIEEFNRLRSGNGSIRLEPELVEAVLKQVETGQVVIGEAGRGTVGLARPQENAQARIETPFLQLVMTRLWDEELGAQSRTLRLATLDRLGGAESIVRTHLDAVMSAQEPQDQDVASGIFHYLVTPSGTKIAYTAFDLAKQAELDTDQVKRVLEKLTHGALRILRPVDPPLDQPSAPRYEIFHDVLAPAVLTWCAAHVQRKRRARAEQRALEQEQRANEQTRIAKRLRRLVAALVVMFLLSLGAVGFAFAQRAQAKHAAENAKASALTAQNYAKESERLRTEGEGLREQGAKAVVWARQEHDLALHNIDVAHREEARAEAAQTRADQSAKAAQQALVKAHSAERNAVVALARLKEAERETEAQKDIRRLNEDLATATSALHTNPEHSMWLAKRAVEEAAKMPPGSAPPTAAAEDVLRRSLLELNESNVTAVLRGHEDAVQRAAFSPDGLKVVTISDDDTARVWNTRTGEEEYELQVDENARVWSARDGEPRTALGNADLPVKKATFSEDGKLIITTGDSGVGFWSAQSGRLVSGLTSYPLNDAVVSKDGKSAIVTSGEKVKILHLDTKLEEERGAARPLPSVEKNWLSPDGKLAMSVAGLKIQIWETATGRVIGSNFAGVTRANLKGTDPRFPTVVPAMVKFSSDGSRVAYSDKNADGLVLLKLKESTSSLTVSPSPTPSEGGDPERELTEVILLEGFKEAVTTMEFAPKSNSLLTLSPDGAVRVWDTDTGRNLATLPRQTEDVTDVEFSPDGRHILTLSSDGTVQVWNIESQSVFATLRGHTGPIFHAGFTPDGMSVVTSGFDGTARIWKWPSDVWRTQPLVYKGAKLNQATIDPKGELLFAKSEDGAQVTRLATQDQLIFPGNQAAFHAARGLVAVARDETRVEMRDLTGKSRLRLLSDPDVINTLGFSRTGRYVLSAGSDNITRVFEAASGKPIAALEGSKAIISPDEKLIFTSGSEGAVIWDWQSNQQKVHAKLGSGTIRDVVGADFSPDSRLIATGSRLQAELWNAQTGGRVVAFPPHKQRVTQVKFSPNGKLIVSVDPYAAQVCEVPLGDTAAATPRCVELTGRTRPTKTASFSRDGKFVVTLGGDSAQVWEASATTVRSVARMHGEELNDRKMQSAAFSDDGKYVVTANGEWLNVWELPAEGSTEQSVEKHVHRFYPGQLMSGAILSPDAKWVIATSNNGLMEVWDWQHPVDGRNESWTAPATMFVLSPDGNSLVTSGPVGVGGVWDTKTWDTSPEHRIAQLEGFASYLKKLLFNPDGSLLAATTGNQVLIWSAGTGEVKARGLLNDLASVESLVFSPDSKLLAGAVGAKILFWDTDGKVVPALATSVLSGHKDVVKSVAFSRDGQFLVSAGKDRTVRVWNVKTGKEIALLRGHFDEVNSVAFSEDGETLVSAGQDKTARVWHWRDDQRQTPVVLTGHRGSVLSAVFSPDGKFVLTAAADRTVRLWNATGGQSLVELVAQSGDVSSAEFGPDGKSIITAGETGARLYKCSECGSVTDLLAEVDRLLKSRPLLSLGKQ